MIPAWWSYLLMTFGVLGIYLAGRQNLWGWAIGVLAQVLWIVYALVTHQYGFIISAIVYAAFYGHNYIKWARRPVRQTQKAGTGSVQIQVGGSLNIS